MLATQNIEKHSSVSLTKIIEFVCTNKVIQDSFHMMKHVGSNIEKKVFDSSSVFFYKEINGKIEILLGKRKENLSAFPDLWSGVGGKVSSGDKNFLSVNSAINKISLLKICVLREVIEETGLVLLKKGVLTMEPPKHIELEELPYDADAYDWINLIPAGLKETPEFTLVNPIFKTQYFLYKLPAGLTLQLSADHYEFTEIAWKTPQEWIDGFENQQLKIPPPVLDLIRYLLIANPEEAAKLSELKNTKPIGLQTRVEIHPGFFIVPLKSQTIPPATTTNALLIGDKSHRYLVDPGSHLPGEQQRILQVVTEITNNDGLQGILLTHHHTDHWKSVSYLQQELNVPVFAHEKTKELLEKNEIDFNIEKTLKDGFVFNLGEDAKKRDWKLEVVYTGGHSQDHTTFLDKRFNALIAGDLVAGIGTVLVEDMGQYLKSLDKLLALKIGVIIPGHGSVHQDGQKLLLQYKEHRLQRLQLILDAFSKHNNKATVDELTELAYSDVVKEYHDVAKIQVQTYLRYLEEKKEVSKEGNKFIKI